MKTIALIEKGKDGTYSIYTPELQSVIIGSGSSADEAKLDFVNSVNEMVSSYDGRDMPDELRDLEFEYKYDLASFFNTCKWINVTQFAKLVGINPSLMRQYKSGMSYISEGQATKIEQGLHKLATQLLSITL